MEVLKPYLLGFVVLLIILMPGSILGIRLLLTHQERYFTELEYRRFPLAPLLALYIVWLSACSYISLLPETMPKTITGIRWGNLLWFMILWTATWSTLAFIVMPFCSRMHRRLLEPVFRDPAPPRGRRRLSKPSMAWRIIVAILLFNDLPLPAMMLAAGLMRLVFGWMLP